ncbi:MAG: trypsin-like peptidase domain-containing protein [Muribaculaceae bacterium]|nr:trypsin-like peptidase domain-containing protein [Alistipes senegalensis]MCM1473908.1 trypsin-like peptidase domain-containing protein [Muribaculaceae bacterium]
MIKLKKLIALGLSSLTAMCFIGISNVNCKINANASYKCDVNGDGKTTVADAVCVAQYLCGLYNIPNPEVADFNNDGFVSEADVTGIQYLDIGIKKPINADYTPSKPTIINNSNVYYNRYDANGNFKDRYLVRAVSNIQSRSIIGDDDRIKDNTHSAICKIVTSTGTGTGFVASDNSILTAGHVVKGSKINSIIFYDSNGNETSFKPNIIDYSIPVYYDDSENSNFDYALIKISNNLSDYNNLNIGYALQYSIDTQATVYVTGYQSADHKQMEVGIGRLDSTSDNYRLHYTCDTVPGVSGAPIYADIIFEGEHYYTVVGIHTNGDPAKEPQNRKYNLGVRICPNITNLIRNNLN